MVEVASLSPTRGERAPETRTGLHTEILCGLLVAALSIATAAIPLIGSRGFYFTDDDQTYFIPGFLEIARLLKAGELPFLSPRLFQGGSFLAEYQYAVLHPVCLLLYLVLDAIPRMDDAASLYALVHIGILAGGVFRLARAVGAHRPAAILAGLSGATSMWLIYWGATNWIPALVSAAWMAWAAALLLRTYDSPTAMPAAAIAVALTILGGWPFADMALLAGSGLCVAATWWRTRDVRLCARPAISLVIGLMLAMPAVLPLAAFLQHAARQPVGPASLHVLQTPPATILAFGLPVFPDAWRTFGSALVLHVSPPMQYVSWWLPLALINADWARLRARAGSAVALVLAATGLFALLAMAPGVWQLRWSFRMLPYMQIGLVIVAAWSISQPGHIWHWRRTIAFVALGSAVAACQDTDLLSVQAMIAAELLCLTALVCLAQARAPGAWIPIVVAGHVVMFAILTGLFPQNGMVRQWAPPPERAAYAVPPLAPGDTNLLLFEPKAFSADDGYGVPTARFRELRQGTMSILGGPSVTGYSPIRSAGLASLCFDYIGAICPEGVARLLAVDPATGANFLDLARVTRVQAQTGDLAQRFAALAGPGWRSHEHEASTRFERESAVPPRPGGVSQVTGDLSILRANESAGRASLDLAPSAQGGRVVWARNWFPGYGARWNGSILPVEIANGVFPSVTVPPGPGGTLVLTYWPAGLDSGLTLAGLAALAWFGLVLMLRRGASRSRSWYSDAGAGVPASG